ncbi:MAG: C69 family dipeptidase [Synergistaceae bacterium]|nr:C69 family dipeptidase [Synergistaceae bacterium]
MSLIFVAAICICILLMKVNSATACMTILVGRNASATGEVLVAHNEDAPGRYTMQTHIVHKVRRHKGSTIKFEADMSELELNETRTSLLWSEAKTYNPENPGPSFCDLYVNGNGVVICSNNCADSREDNPELLDGGIGYGLRRLVAEKAHTAKEALEIACALVDKYGYASSGRSYAFADWDEIYVMQIVHGKHYAIQRVPDDEVAVIPNHYTIHEPDKKARGYNELVNYAVKRGWFDPNSCSTFDFAKVYQAPDSYGLDKNTHRHVRAFEILLEMDLSGLLNQTWEHLPFSIKPAHRVNLATLKKILRTHFEGTNSDNSGGSTPHFMKPLTICNIDTLESTIIQVRRIPERMILHKALGRPCFAPYLAWYYGIIADPEGYEDKDSDTSLAEHFATRPEDMDYKNNAWFRAMEIQAACDILYTEESERVHREIKTLEDRIERELKAIDPQIELRLKTDPNVARAMMEGSLMSWSAGVEQCMNNLKAELNIIQGEAVSNAVPGKNFTVRVPGDVTLDKSQCRCGPSYLPVNKWSECANVTQGEKFTELEFSAGDWLNDATPCFTDLYLCLADSSGRRHAGSVKIQIRRF